MQPIKKQKSNDGTMRPRLFTIGEMLNPELHNETVRMSLSYSPTLPSAIPPQTPIAMPVPMVPTITYGPNGDAQPSTSPIVRSVSMNHLSEHSR